MRKVRLDDGLPRRWEPEITIEEWRRWSVWEYALDEEGVEDQDESTLRPVPNVKIVAPGMYGPVAAEFILADGAVLLGSVAPGLPHTEFEATYTIWFAADGARLSVTLSGPQVGKVPVAVFDEWIARSLEQLQRTFAQAFPIRVRPLVAVSGWAREWELKGFLITDRFGQPMFTEP